MNETDPSAQRVDPQLYARSFADVYDEWYHDLDDPAVLVAAFREHCALGSLIVELGSGTGRLATPLERAGFQVVALDASIEMLAVARPGPHPVAGDMADLPITDNGADAALVAYNTFFNLVSRARQQHCFHEIARMLRPNGVLAIEAFVAGSGDSNDFGITIRSHPSQPQARLAIVTGPDSTDSDVIIGSHIELAATTTCRPWRLTYQSPRELDACALAAGLVLRTRSSDWAGTPFAPAAHRHVSWYEKAWPTD